MSDLPLNDDTDYGLCFACGPRNPSGLKLHFTAEGGRVYATYRPLEIHQGFPGYIHGGVITALLDEVMSRVSLLDNRWTMTARIDVRPIPLDTDVLAVAEKVRQVRGVLDARGEARLPDGTVAAEATARFIFLDAATLAKMSEGYPDLARRWMVG